MAGVEVATIVLDVARAAMGLAANWLIQSTLLIAGGLTVGYLLRRRGSAVQSAIYRTTLVAALVCPLATGALSLLGVSGWSLQMPEVYSSKTTVATVEQTAASATTSAPAAEVDSASPLTNPAPAPTTPAIPNIPPLAVANTGAHETAQPPAIVNAVAPFPVATTPEGPSTFDVSRFGFAAGIIAVLWVGVGALLLCRLAFASWQLHGLRRGARLAEQQTIESCREIANQLKVSPPEVLHSPYLPSPCLAGLRRPAVMLPESELSLPVRDVLVHELAHLVRNDCAWNIARQVATAVLFFQPLAWVLSRRLAAAAEEVCDDYVVQFGGDRREYATRLVDIATMYVAPLAPVGVGIVSFRSLLASRVARILDTSRSLSTRIGHLLLAIVLIAGLSATLLVGLVGLQSAPIATDAEAAKPKDIKSDGEGDSTKSPGSANESGDADIVTVHGQVLDPQGALAKNADVYVIRWFWNYGDRQPLARTKTDAQGRFTISYRKSQFFSDSGRPEQWREATIVAFADGYGFGWTDYKDLGSRHEATLKLIADDVPIEGHIVDLEGEPVSGATIEVDYLNDSKNGNLDEWLAAVRDRQSIPSAAKYLKGGVPLFSAQRWKGIKTDADGRFRLLGIGRERQLEIRVSGPTIVTSTISVVTRDMKPLAQPAFDYRESLDRINYGAKFEYTAAPSRPIEGIVRDAKTHEPIAGVEIWSYKFAGETISGITTNRTKSDAKGHYRLEGMPKGAGNEILVVPTNLPYFTRTLKVSDPPGIDPTPFDIGLHRGQWISGRVLDAATKQPVVATIWYIVPPDNPLASKLPEFEYGRHLMDLQDRFRTKADGSYRVVGLPGRGIVGVGASAAYPTGQGLESIKGVEDRQSFQKYNGVFAPIKKHPTAVKQVQVPADSDATTCDFTLDSGRRITVKAVDPDGKPITGFVVDGSRGASNDNYRKIDGSEFDVAAMGDDEVRTVVGYHESRKLGKAIRLNAKDSAKGPVQLKLEPCATVTGQLVNGDDQPVRGASLSIYVDGDGDYGKSLHNTTTDTEGRFRHDGFLPGLAYSVNAEGAKLEFASVAKKLEVHPGETVDLGKIDVTSKKRPEMMRTPAASAADKKERNTTRANKVETTRYAGTVVTPDGKPADRADIYLVFHVPQAGGRLTPTWKPVGTTDARGEFHFEINPADFGNFARRNEWRSASIVAVKNGYGFAWSSAAFYESSGDLLKNMKARLAEMPANLADQFKSVLSGEGQPLKLIPDDVPLRGHVVDINGQPVAGARLTLLEVWTSPTGDLTEWRKAAKEPNADYYSAREKAAKAINGPQVRSLVTPAVTDANGQFTLHGIGRGRIADLLFEGPGVESARFFACTEPGELIELLQEHRSPDLGTYKYYPAKFDYLAGPSKPIIGVVRDAETKQPLAGITVKSQSRHGHRISGWGQDFVRAVTDSEGRYSLEGMPMGSDNRIAAIAPNDKSYFSSSKSAALKSDGPPLNVDFDLPVGLWVEGRITDKQSGKGLAGELQYLRDKDNPNSKRIPIEAVDERDRLQSDDDGQFRIVASPGLGYVTFSAYDHENYPRADAVVTAVGKKRDVEPSTEPRFMTLVNYHLVAEINPATDAKKYELNLQLDNGGILTGHVVGPDGKPVSGFQYSGRQAQLPVWRPATGDAFEIVGYRADSPRKLYFAHCEKNLAATLTLSGEPQKNLTIKLERAGTAHGRLVDADGEPLAHMQIFPWSPPIASPADLNRKSESVPLPPNSKTWQDGRYESDDKGRFEIACLVPGVEYRLMAVDLASMTPQTGRMPRVSGRLEKSITVESGQTLDLGDVRLTEKSPAKQTSVSATPNGAASATGKLTSTAAPTPISGAPTFSQVTKSETPTTIKNAGPQKVFGAVVGADGKPVAGAKMYWLQSSMRGDQPAPQLIATTDQKGEFAFTFPGMASNEGVTVDHMQSYHVVVVAPGHGMAYLSAYEFRPTDPISAVAKAIANGRPGITVPLPPDASIQGRVVNVDGQPVANARVKVRGITGSRLFSGKWDREDLEARGRSKKEIDWRLQLNELTHVTWPPQLSSIAPTAKTDADGEFELPSIGQNRLAQLLIEGDSIGSAILNVRSSPGETLTLAPAPNFGTQPDTLYATGFTHVAAPSKPLEGRVVDVDTSKPLAGAVVRTVAVHGEKILSSRGRAYLATRTDADGHYRITGLPAGKDNQVVAFTVGDEPYVPVGYRINTDVPGATVNHDFKLKLGVWAEGRAYDATTKAPLPGALEYYMMRNRELERAVPGLRDAFIDEHYFTDKDGHFRVPVLASRGILGFRYAPSTGQSMKYSRGVGAEKIPGGVGKGDSKYFETLPSYMMASNFQAIAEVAPQEGQKSISVDFALSTGRQITVQAVDESGTPVTDLEFYGQNEGWNWQHNVDSKCEVKALQAARDRELYFLQRKRNLVGTVTVNADTKDGLIVKLSPGGGIRGRLVNEEGQPITGATLAQTRGDNPADAAVWPNHPRLKYSPGQIPVDAEGRFEIDGLIPGRTYPASVDVVRKMNGEMQEAGIGRVFADVKIEAGKMLDLGDVRPEPYAQPRPAGKKKSSKPSPKQSKIKQTADASSLPGLKIHGQVIGPDGKPAASAHVAAIAFHNRTTRGGDLTSREETLGQTVTDSNGNYELNLAGAPAKTHTRATLIARTNDTALAWQPLDLEKPVSQSYFSLVPEEPIRGRLIDIEGKPAAQVKMAITSISRRSTNVHRSDDGVGFDKDDAPKAWPAPVTTDDKGGFVIHGIASGHGIFIDTTESPRFAPQSLALNTGMPEQRDEHDGTYRPQVVKNLKPGEEAVLALAPAQVFEGHISYADTGKPAANAQVVIWASQQQQFGSMYSTAGQTDEKGNYHFSPYPGVHFGVTAYAPDGAPYLTREAPEVKWEAAAATKQVDIKLPRGVLVRGTVVDSITGAPIPGAAIEYYREDTGKPATPDLKGVLLGWQTIQLSDDAGKFELTIPPERGRLIAHGPKNEFVIKESSRGELNGHKSGGQRLYAHSIEPIDPSLDNGLVDRVIKLERSKEIAGKLVDEQGQPIRDALVITRLNIHPNSLQWRGDCSIQAHDGRFALFGAAPHQEYDVYFLDTSRRLGAVAKLNSDNSSPTIVLKPCGQATGRFHDESGEPIANFSPSLQMVVTPGASSNDPIGSLAMKAGMPAPDVDYVSNIDRKNYWPGPSTDKQGVVTLPALIPGAKYRLIGGNISDRMFTVEASQTIDLGTLVVNGLK